MKGAVLIFLYVCREFSQSLSSSSNETVRQRTDPKTSKYLYRLQNQDGDFDGVRFHNKEPTEYLSTLDPNLCNATSLNTLTASKFMRLSHYRTRDRTATTDGPDAYDVLSDDFINCSAHTSVEPGCFVLFPNGMVYVPTYKRHFDRSNYVINEGLLFICPDFFDWQFHTEKSTEPPPTLDPDLCNATSSDTLAVSRFKRSNYYHRNQTTTTDSPDSYDILSDEFLNCSAHTNVEPECYVLFPNGTVYVPAYKRYFDRSNYVINEGLLFVCPDFFNRVFQPGKFHLAIGIVSTVGVSVSTLFVLLHIIMFLLVEKLRNLPGYCLFSLCISLLITYTNFFVHLGLRENTECKVFGMFFLFSFLSSFFWMNVISFDVWNSIRVATSQLLLPSKRSVLRKFCFYSVYAWGLPTLILSISIIVHNFTERVEYRLIFRKSTCWFQYKQPPTVYFVVPLFFVIFLDVFFFVSSFYMIMKTRSDSGSKEIHDLKSRLFLSLRLGTVMGLVWILGVVDVLVQSESISYLQSICNGFQGAFIFFSFNFNERTRKACKDTIRRKKSSILPSTAPSQVSSNF